MAVQGGRAGLRDRVPVEDGRAPHPLHDLPQVLRVVPQQPPTRAGPYSRTNCSWASASSAGDSG
ncbi:hypothetical protein STANM309S_01993 [Streptomyces tanashiensis]